MLTGWLRKRPQTTPPEEWAGLARSVLDLGPVRLRNLRAEAEALRRDLDRFLMNAANRGTSSAPDGYDLPAGTDWVWRTPLLESPMPGAGIGQADSGSYLAPGSVLWHDIPDNALVLRQVANLVSDDLPGMALALESFAPNADEGYVALTIDLPPSVLEGLDSSYVIRVETVTGADYPAAFYLRLNIEHGPNTEELLRHLDRGEGGDAVGVETEFDLGYVEMNANRLNKAWLDLIIEKPGMNAFWLRDLVVSRHRRADM